MSPTALTLATLTVLLAEESKYGLYHANLETGTVDLVTLEPAPSRTFLGALSWTPDGRHVLFDATDLPNFQDAHIFAWSPDDGTFLDMGVGNLPMGSHDGNEVLFRREADGSAWRYRFTDGELTAAPRLSGGRYYYEQPNGEVRMQLGFPARRFGRLATDEAQIEWTNATTEVGDWFSNPTWVARKDEDGTPSRQYVGFVYADRGNGSNCHLVAATVAEDGPEVVSTKVLKELIAKEARYGYASAYAQESDEFFAVIYDVRDESKHAPFLVSLPMDDPSKMRVRMRGWPGIKFEDIAVSPDGKHVAFTSDINSVPLPEDGLPKTEADVLVITTGEAEATDKSQRQPETDD